MTKKLEMIVAVAVDEMGQSGIGRTREEALQSAYSDQPFEFTTVTLPQEDSKMNYILWNPFDGELEGLLIGCTLSLETIRKYLVEYTEEGSLQDQFPNLNIDLETDQQHYDTSIMAWHSGLWLGSNAAKSMKDLVNIMIDRPGQWEVVNLNWQ